MLKKIVNQCRFELQLEALEPLLVKSGTTVITGPDMAFVRTSRANGSQPFLPGSSLKGVLRSHAERIARTLQPVSVCDVFKNSRVKGCSWKYKETAKENIKAENASKNYALLCPACQLFGSLLWKGRVHISDAYLTPEHANVKPEIRDGIGIDRVSGGVAGGAKFDMEVLPAGVIFRTALEIENFEAWQLGWMSYVVRDLLEGHLRVGSGTSRGLGRLKGKLNTLSVSYIGTPAQLQQLDIYIPGIGTFVSEEERALYGLKKEDRVPKPDDFTFKRPPGSLRTILSLPNSEDQTRSEEQTGFLTAIAGAWDAFIANQTSLLEAR